MLLGPRDQVFSNLVSMGSNRFCGMVWWTHLCGSVWFDATMNNNDGGVRWGGLMKERHTGLVWVECGS
jgi:hypothetical protein